jgi:hypothetical protein
MLGVTTVCFGEISHDMAATCISRSGRTNRRLLRSFRKLPGDRLARLATSQPKVLSAIGDTNLTKSGKRVSRGPPTFFAFDGSTNINPGPRNLPACNREVFSLWHPVS